jgi:hypothetical protein
MPKSMKRSTITNNVWYKNMLVGNDAFSPGAYDLISTQVLGSSAASVTFSSIPQTYRHLQIRYVYQPVSGNATLQARFNSDASSVYNTHQLGGGGSSVFSAYSTGTEISQLGYANSLTGYEGFGVIDILDYANTSKNTTTRAFRGRIDGVVLASGLWRNTAAVTSIFLNTDSSTFNTNSRFSLYGIKG